MTLLSGSAAPGFDDPIEMLLVSHGTIQAQCETLHRLSRHLQARVQTVLHIGMIRELVTQLSILGGKGSLQHEAEKIFPVFLRGVQARK